MSELKPCPFCGEAGLIASEDRHGTWVHCLDGGCVTGGETMDIDDWNRRPIEDALRQRIAELAGRLTQEEAQCAQWKDRGLAAETTLAMVQEWRDKTTYLACSCHPQYKTMGRADPSCSYCDQKEDYAELDALLASTPEPLAVVEACLHGNLVQFTRNKTLNLYWPPFAGRDKNFRPVTVIVLSEEVGNE